VLDQLEGRVRVSDGIAEIEITEPGPSRNLVAEAMILAGAVIAEMANTHGLALPFRSQLPVTLPSQVELSALPPGPVRHAAIKKCLGRGLTSTTAAAHFSLGLKAYVQATSPIRRYGDLLVQRQLLAHSQNLEPLDSAAMVDLINQMDIGIRQAIAISRDWCMSKSWAWILLPNARMAANPPKAWCCGFSWWIPFAINYGLRQRINTGIGAYGQIRFARSQGPQGLSWPIRVTLVGRSHWLSQRLSAGSRVINGQQPVPGAVEVEVEGSKL
jgi:hypothetical protein